MKCSEGGQPKGAGQEEQYRGCWERTGTIGGEYRAHTHTHNVVQRDAREILWHDKRVGIWNDLKVASL